MKSRRMMWLAVLLAVCVCMPAVAQEGAPIVTYALPQGAVEWALDRSVQPGELESVLRGELNAIAQAKGITAAEAEEAVYRNLMEFVYG